MENKIIESIQRDRQREAAAERLNASMRPQKQPRRRFSGLLTTSNSARTPRSAMPRTIG
jgi:hypothetical protein